MKTMPLPLELRPEYRRNELNGELARLATGRLTISEFIDACHELNDAKLEAALDGIWCGQEGRMSEPYDDKHNLTVGWCYGRLEFAYVA
jgi:hypothetical protein